MSLMDDARNKVRREQAKAHAEKNGKLLDVARPSEVLVPNESADDPHRLARLYIRESCQHPEGLTLRCWRGRWFRWNGSAYRELPVAELYSELTASAKREMDRLNMIAQEQAAAKGTKTPTVQRITRGLIGNVELALASMTTWSSTIEPPALFDGNGWQRRNLVAMTNGVLDIDSLFDGNADVLLPHTPRWFSMNCLPYPYDPNADCPRWKEFLARNLEGDDERIGLLQEWFGYCLITDTALQKFLMLVGEGANGKSVICAVLEATLGSDNCAHVPLELFGARFQLAGTLGKLANICAEVGELDKAAEGYLKAYTSGDLMQFEQKYEASFSATPTARLALATNNPPRFSDKSDGIWRRLILFPLDITITDEERIYGMDKVDWWVASGELPGILNWALDGLDRLRLQGGFTRSNTCDESLDKYRTENNPARMFLRETCQESPDGETPCEALYGAYQRWCELNGYSPLADRSFGKEVRRVFKKSERRKVGARDRRVWCYCGVDNNTVKMADVMGRFFAGGANGTAPAPPPG
jgi:putative DNA primase/helicase